MRERERRVEPKLDINVSNFFPNAVHYMRKELNLNWNDSHSSRNILYVFLFAVQLILFAYYLSIYMSMTATRQKYVIVHKEVRK